MLRSELWERIQLCPAFGLKYVEVSCRTNHEVARMERMLLLGLRQLPSLAQIREGQAGGAKGKKAEWEGHHPWRPFDRDKDLDIRAAKPKSKESILNNEHMGKLGDRFGGGRRETTFM